jgi:hypothetical protein
MGTGMDGNGDGDGWQGNVWGPLIWKGMDDGGVVSDLKIRWGIGNPAQNLFFPSESGACPMKTCTPV